MKVIQATFIRNYYIYFFKFCAEKEPAALEREFTLKKKSVKYDSSHFSSGL